MNDKLLAIDNHPTINTLYQRISKHLNLVKRNILQNINVEMVKAYWLIGYEIVEEEQRGNNRAKYGEELIRNLSLKLSNEFGKGYSISNLRNMRKFYLTYQNQIRQTLSSEFEPKLSWSQYCLLMQISNVSARDFYEKETLKNYWSVRELERQIGSLLYERLSRSRNKEDIIKLALEGQEIEKPQDAIKDPLILEFLNIPEPYQLNENKIEEALITNLQQFLLELGKGFAFVERQKRITLNGNNFYVDLVFYHAILKCYVLIELKTRKVTHADLGQIQFYVNYFDQEIITEGDSPTIGLVLCTDKNDAMVKYTLGEKNQQIFASKYQFHLPSETELEIELKREIKEIEQRMYIKTIVTN